MGTTVQGRIGGDGVRSIVQGPRLETIAGNNLCCNNCTCDNFVGTWQVIISGITPTGACVHYGAAAGFNIFDLGNINSSFFITVGGSSDICAASEADFNFTGVQLGDCAGGSTGGTIAIMAIKCRPKGAYVDGIWCPAEFFMDITIESPVGSGAGGTQLLASLGMLPGVWTIFPSSNGLLTGGTITIQQP